MIGSCLMNKSTDNDKEGSPAWIWLAIFGFTLAIFGAAYWQTGSVWFSCAAVVFEFFLGWLCIGGGLLADDPSH